MANKKKKRKESNTSKEEKKAKAIVKKEGIYKNRAILYFSIALIAVILAILLPESLYIFIFLCLVLAMPLSLISLIYSLRLLRLNNFELGVTLLIFSSLIVLFLIAVIVGAVALVSSGDLEEIGRVIANLF